jgi:hypothetical protein
LLIGTLQIALKIRSHWNFFNPVEFHQIAIDGNSNEPMLTESGGQGEGHEFHEH